MPRGATASSPRDPRPWWLRPLIETDVDPGQLDAEAWSIVEHVRETGQLGSGHLTEFDRGYPEDRVVRPTHARQGSYDWRGVERSEESQERQEAERERRRDRDKMIVELAQEWSGREARRAVARQNRWHREWQLRQEEEQQGINAREAARLRAERVAEEKRRDAEWQAADEVIQARRAAEEVERRAKQEAERKERAEKRRAKREAMAAQERADFEEAEREVGHDVAEALSERALAQVVAQIRRRRENGQADEEERRRITHLARQMTDEARIARWREEADERELRAAEARERHLQRLAREHARQTERLRVVEEVPPDDWVDSWMDPRPLASHADIRGHIRYILNQLSARKREWQITYAELARRCGHHDAALIERQVRQLAEDGWRPVGYSGTVCKDGLT